MALSKAFPNGKLRTLDGETHDVSPETLAPVLASFFVSIETVSFLMGTQSQILCCSSLGLE
jgi:hypothetical protein